MNTWKCPYCDRQLPDERAVCCQEAGHAVPEDDLSDGMCDCGAIHSEGTEEADSGICSCCGGTIS